jgi:hypothetical protein
VSEKTVEEALGKLDRTLRVEDSIPNICASLVSLAETVRALAREKADKAEVPPQCEVEETQAERAAWAKANKCKTASERDRSERDDARHDATVAASELDAAKAALAQMTAERDELRRYADSWQAAYVTEKNSVRSLRVELNASALGHDALRAELDAAKTRIVALEDAVAEGEAARIERNAAWVALDAAKASAAEAGRLNRSANRDCGALEAELERYRAAFAELRSLTPICDDPRCDCLTSKQRSIIDRAESSAAPLSTPSPDAPPAGWTPLVAAENDLAAATARADTLERERNSALLERDEARKALAKAEAEYAAERTATVARLRAEASEAKDALRRWGYAAEALREMFPEHPNHPANSCVACLVRDRLFRAEQPPDFAF